MTTALLSTVLAATSAGVARDWQELREDGDIQFAPVKLAPPPEPPDWLKQFSDWLSSLLEPLARLLGMSWSTLQTVLIALAALLVLWLAWKLLMPVVERWRARDPLVAEPEWTPDRASARALLADADRLAGEGRYDEAVHLLLRRSVDHIADHRPDWLFPASTAREIASFPMLGTRAREAFATIATRVERSLFALRRLDAADWQAARGAYADFALAELAA